MISATLNVNKLPDMTDKTGYVVIINDHGKLWYYGLYDTYDRAWDAVKETDDRFMVKI